MSNIDWNFILEKEGYKLQGYVPDPENSKSGVTIASGFDLGARTIEDLKGLPQDIIDALKPFLGFQGVQAEEIATNLNITEDKMGLGLLNCDLYNILNTPIYSRHNHLFGA